MKKKDVIGLYQGLNNVGLLKGARFTYAVARNLAELKVEIEALQKSVEPSKQYLEYDEKRVELAKKYAKKNEAGEAVLENRDYVLEDKEGFNAAIVILQEEYKQALEEREQQVKEYEKTLDDDIDVKLYMLSPDSLPDDITAQQTFSIISILED